MTDIDIETGAVPSVEELLMYSSTKACEDEVPIVNAPSWCTVRPE